MKNYKINGSVVEITLENEKVVKVSKKWVDNAIKNLETDIEDVLLMYLEDNDYLTNDEQDDLDKNAKGKVKLVATQEKPKKKTQRERVVKENPEKEYIISSLEQFLQKMPDISDIIVENKGKIITFSYKSKEYKLDLVQKRAKKV